MKKLFLLFLFGFLGTTFSYSQSFYALEGQLVNKISNIGIHNHTVHYFTDSVYDSSTHTFWQYGNTQQTWNGGFGDSIMVPQGIHQFNMYIFTYDCNNNLVDTTVVFSQNQPFQRVTLEICENTTNCKAFFSYHEGWDTLNATKIYFFNNSSSTNMNKFYWTFGDSTSSTYKNPIHTYQYESYKKVKLVAEDTINNCIDSFTRNIHVYFPNKCIFNIEYQKVDDTFTFYAIDSYYNHNAQFSWDFGDGNTATGRVVQHKFKKYGTFRVTLTGTDSSKNCSSTFYIIVHNLKPVKCYSYFYYTNNGNSFTFFGDSMQGNAIYHWDFGNGDTDTGWSVSRTFTPGDSAKACLTTIIGTDTCQMYCDYLLVPIVPTKGRITVRIVKPDSTSITNNAHAYLIYFNPNDSTLTSIRTSSLFRNGEIVFDTVPFGTYLVKVALDSLNSNYQNYLPTYYYSSLFWSQANDIVLSANNSNVYAYITLIPGNNPGGPGFIGGKVSQGANAPGDAMEDVEIILLDESNNPVLYDYSSNLGNFEFPELPFGTYTIYPEVAGKYPITKTVTIDQQNPEVRNVRVSVNTKSVSVEFVEGVSESIKSISKIYPNPTAKEAFIEIDVAKSTGLQINIYDALGKKASTKSYDLNKGKHKLEINTSILKNSFYYVELISEDGYKTTYKLLKQN
jgi:PKD repeat protein